MEAKASLALAMVGVSRRNIRYARRSQPPTEYRFMAAAIFPSFKKGDLEEGVHCLGCREKKTRETFEHEWMDGELELLPAEAGMDVFSNKGFMLHFAACEFA